MKIYLSQFNYDERYDCFIAKAHVNNVCFAVLVNPYMKTIDLFPVRGGSSAEEIKATMGPYAAEVFMDYIAAQFGWEAA